MKATPLVLAAAITIAGISYSSWVLEFVLHTGLDPATSFLSELSAVGKPYREVFGNADTVTGVLALVGSIIGAVVFPRRRFVVVGWVALAVFGAATIADSEMPITCIPTPTHPCPSEPSGLFPQLHSFHAMTSTIAVNAIFVAMIAFSIAAFRYKRWPVLREFGLVILLIASAATAWMLIADNLSGDHSLGIAQRIQVASISLWLVTLGIAALLTGRGQSADGEPSGRLDAPARVDSVAG